MMKRPLGLSVAILAATTLGLLALLAIHNRPPYQAAAMDGLPMASAGTAFFVVGFPPEDLTFFQCRLWRRFLQGVGSKWGG